MKRIFTLSIVVFVGYFLSHAQVVMTKATHGLSPGEAHSCQKVEYMDPGDEGVNITWDFSQLKVLDDLSNSTVEVDESHEGCNLIVKRNDRYSFLFNITDQMNEYKGYQIGGRTVYFEDPIIKSKYPQTYGTHFEGNFKGTVSNWEGTVLDGDISGTYSTYADATGTILLPEGICLPVLRVKTVERINEWVSSKQITEVVKYLWYTQNVRYPLLVSLESTKYNQSGEKLHSYQESYLNTDIKQELKKVLVTAGSPAVIAEISYQVFPNPFKGDFQVHYSLPQEVAVTIELFNSQGNRLTTILPAQLQKGDHTLNCNVSQYTRQTDVYLLVMKFGDKVYQEKLIKANY